MKKNSFINSINFEVKESDQDILKNDENVIEVSPIPDFLTYLKYNVVSKLSLLMRENDLEVSQLVNDLKFSKSDLSLVLNYKLNRFKLDRLVEMYSRVFECYSPKNAKFSLLNGTDEMYSKIKSSEDDLSIHLF